MATEHKFESGTFVGAVSPWSNPGHWRLPSQPPNLWRRFWIWLLLGWRWELPK
jgi:hypothetical protein